MYENLTDVFDDKILVLGLEQLVYQRRNDVEMNGTGE
jgi:hypothetical protein